MAIFAPQTACKIHIVVLYLTGKSIYREIFMKKLENFGFNRGAGVLMPVSSLPSKYGIGNFGKDAYLFVDFLKRTEQKCWQVLPLVQTSYGDSPYQAVAAASLNPYFIDPDTLVSKGLLTKKEAKPLIDKSRSVDYGRLFFTRYDALRLAYSRFTPDKGYCAFLRREGGWVKDYALYMALKVKNSYAPWYAWCDEEKSYALAKEKFKENQAECGFWLWVQYELDSEWRALKGYAKENGIMIIGDMPIYVAHDSLDVWRSPEQFMLDESFNPRFVAGCPPDAYAEDGQLWGNPIYDWDKMKSEGFGWWLDRVGRSFRLYDILRIDHFRGFASYWSIPYGDGNAKRGSWVAAPGKELFDAVRAAYPRAKIIAEDLGTITDDVRELLSYTAFPGMKVLQFAFYSEDSEYLPKNYTTENCVVYTASHDSDCSKSWAKSISGDTLRIFKKHCKRNKDESKTDALIRLAMESRGALCVIPIQDYLGLTNAEGRMNTPSVAMGNWTFRVSPRFTSEKLKNKILSITKKSKRNT